MITKKKGLDIDKLQSQDIFTGPSGEGPLEGTVADLSSTVVSAEVRKVGIKMPRLWETKT